MATFTTDQGDPGWLRSQRESAARATAPLRASRAMPYPTSTTKPAPVEADRQQFVHGAKSNSGAAFVLGVLVGAAVSRGRR